MSIAGLCDEVKVMSDYLLNHEVAVEKSLVLEEETGREVGQRTQAVGHRYRSAARGEHIPLGHPSP